MKKALNISITSDPQKGVALGGGWRIKERKPTRSANSANRIAGPIRTRPENAAEHTACAAGHDKSRRRWRHPFGVLASMSAAVVALIMVADVLPPWLNPSSVSQPANAETPTSPTLMPGQKTTAQQTRPHDVYQLYLGAYRSELGARLVWVGLEAYPGTKLDGLEPLFKPHQSERAGTFYHLLAGKFSGYDEADSRCAWLRERDVTCSIVGG